VIFYRPRSFSRDEFRGFRIAQSRRNPIRLEIAAELANYEVFLATLNNEILELNLYRIPAFRSSQILSVFFSSCFSVCGNLTKLFIAQP